MKTWQTPKTPNVCPTFLHDVGSYRATLGKYSLDRRRAGRNSKNASIQQLQQSRPRASFKAKAKDLGHKAKAEDSRYQGQGSAKDLNFVLKKCPRPRPRTNIIDFHLVSVCLKALTLGQACYRHYCASANIMSIPML